MNRAHVPPAAGLLLWLALPASAAAAPGFFNFPPGGILQWAVVSDTTPCAGRPVVVLVGAQHPTVPGGPVELYVDGDPGVPQIVQYFGPDPQRRIPLFAITRERLTDRREITIDVRECPAQTATLEMRQGKNPFHPNRVDFRAVLKGRRARLYRWLFGDGQQAVTREPFVSHDYSPAVQANERYSYFTPLVQETGSGLLSGKRIALGSSFDLSRSLGFVQAEVEPGVTKTGTGFAVELEVRNHHHQPIHFERYLKHYLPCDTRDAPRVEHVLAESVFGTGVPIVRPPDTHEPGVVTVPQGGEVRSRLLLPLEKIPPETCALGFNLIGKSEDRRDAYGSFYLPVRRNRLKTTPVTDARTLLALKGLVEDELVPNADQIAGEDLYLLEQRGLLARTGSGWRRLP